MRTFFKFSSIILLVVISILISVFIVYISTERELTRMEAGLLQAFSLIFSIVGSFAFGKISAQDAAREIIKPHAKSSFRRIMSLYDSLSRVAFVISDRTSKDNTIEEYEITLARLESIVIEQLVTADDAMQDWSDIIPAEVAELRSRADIRKNRVNKMVDKIKAKVARILNTREMVINAGAVQGVIVGMYFDVMDPNGENILDPDTNEILGSIARPKVRVQVTQVQDKMSVASTYKKKTVNIGGRGGPWAELGSISLALMPPKYIDKFETLKTEEKTWEDLSESDSYVKTGDPVEQVIETIEGLNSDQL